MDLPLPGEEERDREGDDEREGEGEMAGVDDCESLRCLLQNP